MFSKSTSWGRCRSADGTWSYPDAESTNAHVVLADIDNLAHTDCRSLLPGSLQETGVPLAPEQRAAVLRNRCLSFLFNIHGLAVPLEGVTWQTHGKQSVDAAYLTGIDRDMARGGLQSGERAPDRGAQ
ncbi:hypothetical protein ABZ826_29615 [Streptomyces sp. NPDC047515]|uniref:hypothetical protein n=1 Tax=Streptomyces sp. NPDC047515 TaxID=3155380 RepID=UPI0033ECFC79